MKSAATILALLALLVLAGGVLARSGASYELSSWTVAGGGGASSGGSFDVTGTAGQAAVGVSRGGDYSVAGGFWGGGELPEELNVYLPVVQ
jgi:hypothetical protein